MRYYANRILGSIEKMNDGVKFDTHDDSNFLLTENFKEAKDFLLTKYSSDIDKLEIRIAKLKERYAKTYHLQKNDISEYKE